LLARGAARHCASANLQAFYNRDSFPATYLTCNATRIMLNKICTRTAKTRAIPSLHPRCSLRSRGARRDSFAAKVPGPCPVLASGNTTSLYCRAVRLSKNLIVSLQPKNKTFPNKI
jgi:hypothetical protein